MPQIRSATPARKKWTTSTCNLLLRMTVNAMGKAVKKNKSDIVTVALIMTFATEGDKEAFRSISKDCGVRAQPSLPKGYIEQKGMIMTLLKKKCFQGWGGTNGSK